MKRGATNNIIFQKKTHTFNTYQTKRGRCVPLSRLLFLSNNYYNQVQVNVLDLQQEVMQMVRMMIIKTIIYQRLKKI